MKCIGVIWEFFFGGEIMKNGLNVIDHQIIVVDHQISVVDHQFFFYLYKKKNKYKLLIQKKKFGDQLR